MVEREKLGEGNSWATITTAPHIILKLVILEKREGFIQAMGRQKKSIVNGGGSSLGDVSDFLYELYLEVLPFLRKEGELRSIIVRGLQSSNLNDIEQAFEELSYFLYDKGLTKWDTGGGFDGTSWEESNRAKG